MDSSSLLDMSTSLAAERRLLRGQICKWYNPLMTEAMEPNPLQAPSDIHLNEPRWETVRDVNKYNAILGAGAVAIEMQLAHPFVAQAIEDAGYFTNDPLRRLRETARAGIDLIFAEPREAEAVARRVQGMHMKVDSKQLSDRILKEDLGPHYKAGDPYSANDQEAQKWVAASIVYASFKGYETFVGPLSDERKQQYLTEVKELFATMGLHEPLPNTEEDLNAYIQGMIDDQKVIVSEAARKLSPKVLIHGVFPGSEVAASYLKLTTIALMPEKLRKQYGSHAGLQKLTPNQLRAFDLSAKAIRKALRYLPGVVTLNSRAREATKRNS